MQNASIRELLALCIGYVSTREKEESKNKQMTAIQYSKTQYRYRFHQLTVLRRSQCLGCNDLPCTWIAIATEIAHRIGHFEGPSVWIIAEQHDVVSRELSLQKWMTQTRRTIMQQRRDGYNTE